MEGCSVGKGLVALPDLLLCHGRTGDGLVVFGGNGDSAEPVIDAEQDVLTGPEASVFE